MTKSSFFEQQRLELARHLRVALVMIGTEDLYSERGPLSLPPHLVPRHALLNSFHRAAWKRLVHVCAPAGAGKTVAALLWLRHTGLRGAWMQLGERHNSSASFYAGLGRCLAGLQPGSRGAATILARQGFGSAPVEHCRRLIAGLSADERGCVCIIDDFHLVDNEDILKSLPDLLLGLPMGFCAVILSRAEPPPAFRQLLEQERAAAVSAPEFVFSTAEIAAYFASCGKQMTEAEAAAVAGMTRGWAMGVSALALGGSMTCGASAAEALERYMRDYIWDRWPPRTREFLLKTSFVEELTPELCAILTGMDNSEELLRQLCAGHMFMLASGDGAFRCHQLFREYLLGRLERAPDIDIKELYRKAAGYYLEKGMFYETLNLSARAGDQEGIERGMLRLFQYSTPSNSVAEHAAMHKMYFIDIVPEDMLRKKPYLLMNYAWYYYLMGDAERALAYMDRLYLHIDEIIAGHGHFIELVLLTTTLDFRKPPTGIVLEPGREHLALTRGEQMQTVTMTENMPFYHRSNQDYSCYALDLPGSLDSFSRAFKDILGPEILKISTTGLAAGIRYEQNRLKEAADLADRTVAALAPDSVGELKMGALLLRALTRLAREQDEDYVRGMAELKELLVSEGAEYLMPNVLAVEKKYALMNADKSEARKWLANYFVSIPNKPEFFKFFIHLTTVRALMVLNESGKALRLLGALAKMALAYRRPLDQAETGLLEVCLNWALGQREQAVEKLEEVALSMQTYGFLRVIVDEGAAVLPALKELCRRVDDPGYRGDLKPAFLREAVLNARLLARTRRGVAWNINPRPLKLSTRQKEILRLLNSGCRHRQIADILSLSLPTVKTHINHMYKKFNVNCVADALLKARELELL